MKKLSKNQKRYILYSIVLIIIIIAYLYAPENVTKKEETNSSVAGEGMDVTFVDVGKADATIISADGHNILIDAGEERAAKSIIEVLEEKNIEKLDMVVVSHNDADHIGGMTTILNNYKVKNFLTYDVEDKYQSTTKTYNTMLDAIEDNNVNVTYTKAGDTYTLGDMKLKVISPDHEYEDINDDSVVVKLSYGESDFLFTGDASHYVEKDLLNSKYDLNCEVLKVSHHGSKTATSQEFLEAVNPEIAVVPIGKNRYNLPDDEVISRLENYPLTLYRSDYDGNIYMTSDGKKITVTTERESNRY